MDAAVNCATVAASIHWAPAIFRHSLRRYVRSRRPGESTGSETFLKARLYFNRARACADRHHGLNRNSF